MKTKFTFLLIGLLLAFQAATAATATFNVTVPNDGGSDNHHQTNRVMMVGNFNGWNAGGAVECTKVDATHYTVTLDEATFVVWENVQITLANIKYKYVCGPDWAYVMKLEIPVNNSDEVADQTYGGTSPQVDIVERWASVWKDVVPVPGTFTIDIYTPKNVTEMYCTGNFNEWKTPGYVGTVDNTDTKMNLVAASSDANGNYFSIKVYTSNAYALAYQFATGKAWMYQQNQPNNSYTDVTQSSILFDAVGDATKTPPVAPEITFKRIYNASLLKTVTLNVTPPANTNQMYIKNEKNGGAGEFIAGVKNVDGTFTFTVADVDIMYYKYYNDQLDANVEYKADNTAVTENRTADAQIQTTFTDTVLAWVATGINTLDANKYKVYTSNKSIVVEGVTTKAELFDITGRGIESKVMSGTFRTAALNAGLYIVKIDGQTQKVSVK